LKKKKLWYRLSSVKIKGEGIMFGMSMTARLTVAAVLSACVILLALWAW
jgi:hypothetical protein